MMSHWSAAVSWNSSTMIRGYLHPEPRAERQRTALDDVGYGTVQTGQSAKIPCALAKRLISSDQSPSNSARSIRWPVQGRRSAAARSHSEVAHVIEGLLNRKKWVCVCTSIALRSSRLKIALQA